MKLLKRCFWLLFIAAFALTLRIPYLRQRPMQADEAVQAFKFGQLLEKSEYRYDPADYHGPTLNYFTLIPARLTGCKNFAQLNEETLRIVPVFFGVLLVLLPLLIADCLGRYAAFFAALLFAISTAMVFYSRYYIHEMLLVFFSLAFIVSGYRFFATRKIYWAVAAGASAGLMYATKETCIIAFASMLASFYIVRFLSSRHAHSFFKIGKPAEPFHILIAIGTALLISAVFYSSFFRYPSAFSSSFASFRNYLLRSADDPFNIHPWYYYLQLLFFAKVGSFPIWAEAFIVLLAICGCIFCILKKNWTYASKAFVQFLCFYTIFTAVIYSLIPYKTPWCLLNFLSGFILLAGFAASEIFDILIRKINKFVVITLFSIFFIYIYWQSIALNFKYYADPANPYAYAQTSKDIFLLSERAEKVASIYPDGHNVHIEVVCSQNHWPIPWYLRKFSNVGYWKQPDSFIKPAPVIIVSSDLENDVLKILNGQFPAGSPDLYVSLFDKKYIELRPAVYIAGFVQRNLYEKLAQLEK